MSDNKSDLEDSGNIDRRTVLKGLGAGTAASTFPIGGVASAQQSAPEGEVEITGTTGVSPDKVEEDIQAITQQKESKKLAARIKNETGFSLNSEFAVGIDLETDDEDLNEHDPRVMHVPLKPSNASRVPSVQSNDKTVPSGSEFSIDNGGVLLALTVQENGERKLATLMGITREKSQGGLLSTNSTETVTTKSYVVEDGSAKIDRKNASQQPLKAKWQTELGKNTPTVTPTGNGGFTCWGCATVVGIACAGAATLSYSTCVSAAFASSVFSPTAGAAVAAFCTYIVTNAGTLSCAAGTAAICAGVTNDCQFLED